MKQIGIFLKKACYKVSLCETFSSIVVRHLLAYLTVHEWLVGDGPLYLKFWAKVTQPLQKRRLSIDIRS